MTKFTVHYFGGADKRKFTPGQFLAEFAEVEGGRSRVLDLPHPVSIHWVDESERGFRERFTTAGALFAFFQRLHHARGTISSLTTSRLAVGPSGLYLLNHAIREHAVRIGGLNIVRHWLENRRGCRTPLGVDLAALFDYLEIRPLFRVKTRKPTPTPTLTQPTPAT